MLADLWLLLLAGLLLLTTPVRASGGAGATRRPSDLPPLVDTTSSARARSNYFALSNEYLLGLHQITKRDRTAKPKQAPPLLSNALAQPQNHSGEGRQPRR